VLKGKEFKHLFLRLLFVLQNRILKFDLRITNPRLIGAGLQILHSGKYKDDEPLTVDEYPQLKNNGRFR
jgi:hypothetical protein